MTGDPPADDRGTEGGPADQRPDDARMDEGETEPGMVDRGTDDGTPAAPAGVTLQIADPEDRPDDDVPAVPTGDGEGAHEEDEPVELLVQLAEEGEIDPWDIDIVAVTDKFLARLDEADLRTSGRALFYASVLLRMKSDAMLERDDDPEAEEAAEPWDAPRPADELDGPDPIVGLEREMDRRLERKRARGKPETLDELVRELREAERQSRWWKESRSYDTSGSPHGFSRGTQTLDYRAGDDMRLDDEPTEADVTGTAHHEAIETVIDDVEAILGEHFDAGRDEVLFREIEAAGGTRVETFLALLFLAHRGLVRLQQDELFGDLWVQDPHAVGASEEAVAG